MMDDKQEMIEATVVEMNEGSNPNEDVISLLKQIQQDTAEQKELQKKRLTLSKVSTAMVALLTVIIMISLAWILPTFNNLAKTADVAIAQLTTVMQDIEVIAKEIQEANLVNILKNVNGLLEETNEKITALDVNELNQALKNLGDALSPLAKMFGGRG